VNKISTDIIEAFYRFSRREQIVLLWGALVLGFYLLWKLLVVPVFEHTQTQVDRNKEMAVTLAQVQSMAATLKSAAKETPTAAGGGSIAELIDRSLQKQGLRMAGFQPGANGEARLRLDNVTFAGLTKWLYELEFTHGVQVRELSVTSAANSGLVMVNLRVRKEV
jgi:general secretion pathway protein M